MSILKQLLSFVLFSNFYIGIAAAALTAITVHTLNLSNSLHTIFFNFIATVVIYSFHAVYSIQLSKDFTVRRRWLSDNLPTLNFFWISGSLILFASLFILQFPTIILLVCLAGFSFFYTIKIRIGTRLIGLKQFKYFKVPLIAMVWSVSTVWVPVFEADIAEGMILTKEVLVLFFERFFLILALCIPFDLRDFKEDKSQNLLTLPVFFGIKASKLIALSALCIFGLFSVSSGKFFPTSVVFISSVIFILLSGRDRNEYFYSLAGDGLMIMYAILFLINP